MGKGPIIYRKWVYQRFKNLCTNLGIKMSVFQHLPGNQQLLHTCVLSYITEMRKPSGVNGLGFMGPVGVMTNNKTVKAQSNRCSCS